MLVHKRLLFCKTFVKLVIIDIFFPFQFTTDELQEIEAIEKIAVQDVSHMKLHPAFLYSEK